MFSSFRLFLFKSVVKGLGEFAFWFSCSVYLLTPLADLLQGVRMDGLFPFEVAFASGLSFICLLSGLRVIRELMKL